MEAVLSEISASVRSDSSAALWLMLRNFLKLDYWDPAEISSTLLKVCGSACSDDNLDLLERYLGVGEDLEFVPDQWGPRGSGFTALHRCCLFGQPRTAEFLLKRGAKTDATRNYGTAPHPIPVDPLCMAVYTNHHEMVALLLEYGASVAAAVQAHPALGGTVFALSDVRMMRLLVDAGLDPRPLKYDEMPLLEFVFGHAAVLELRLLTTTRSDSDHFNGEKNAELQKYESERKKTLEFVRYLVHIGSPDIAADVIHIAIRKFGYLTLIETLKYHLECGRVLLWPTQFASKVPHPDVNLLPPQSEAVVQFTGEILRLILLRNRWSAGDCEAFLLYLSECAGPGEAVATGRIPMSLAESVVCSLRRLWMRTSRDPAHAVECLTLPGSLKRMLCLEDLERRLHRGHPGVR